MILLIKAGDSDEWRRNLGELMPELETRVFPDVGNPADIDYALVWNPPDGLLASLPNLKAILSVGAGVDGILKDPLLPADIPIVRMVESGLTEGMTEWIVLQVLALHRNAAAYRAQQAAAIWEPLPEKLARERRIGILGLGELGAAAARALAALNFDVAGWSRSPRHIDGVAGFHGAAGLPRLLERSEILVNLLPLTPETENLLNAQVFAALPHGAAVVNAARGRHVVDDDLIAALDSGQLSAAVLDVFREEPLPPRHPYWSHPKVTITPHVAAVTHPRSAAAYIARQIRRIEAGEAPESPVDARRGY